MHNTHYRKVQMQQMERTISPSSTEATGITVSNRWVLTLCAGIMTWVTPHTENIPQSHEQTRRSASNRTTEFSTGRLLGRDNIISDRYITQEWSCVMEDRQTRNQIVNYVGGNAHHSSLPKDRTLVINSEFMVNEDTVIPHL